MKFEMNGTTVMHVMLEKTKKKGETKRISIRQIYAVLLSLLVIATCLNHHLSL